jgi:hypothetical protein
MRAVGYVPANSAAGTPGTWRTSPSPLELPEKAVAWLHKLGPMLQLFNSACNDLYQESVSGHQARWIANTIDHGKPEVLVHHSRLPHLLDVCPRVIRPDLIAGNDGMTVVELDSVPGGMGITACFEEAYASLKFSGVSGVPLPQAFASMLRAATPGDASRAIIVISKESAAYMPEMAWLARSLVSFGIQARVAAPEELVFTDKTVVARQSSEEFEATVVYRFFELHDLANIAGADRLLKLDAARHITVVPPFRYQLEEKSWLAIYHEPSLAGWWRDHLGDDVIQVLNATIPRGWVLDPDRPPANFVPGVTCQADPSWDILQGLGRRSRRYVIKPSGFSELAWGSRGVVVGHDIGTEEWNQAARKALGEFGATPHVLQEFHGGAQFQTSFLDHTTGRVVPLRVRVRLTPYYFVTGSGAVMTSVLATGCPLDKKRIHGMSAAVMSSCTSTRARRGTS